MRFIHSSAVVLLLYTLVSFAAAAPRDEDSSALINEALDKPVKLQINTELPKAMKAIADKTGVRITADDIVWDLLPWGEQTRVTATIENQTLREALSAIARKLGLEAVLQPQAVDLRPAPALRRLGRRATVQELESLDLLTANNLNLPADHSTVKSVVDAVDKKLEDLKSPFAIEFRPGATVNPEQAVVVPRNATLSEALESLVKDSNATWYPWGNKLVIVPKEQQVRNQLDKTIAVRYNAADITQVLVDLAKLAGVEFTIEPGAIQRIPTEYRNVNLRADTKVRDALENIAGFTGLSYTVNSKGVYISNSSTAVPGNNAPAAGSDPAVGMIQLDNGMQVFVRRSEVDADLAEYLQVRRKRELDKIRAMMKEEGFKPSTKPAVTPAPAEATKPGDKDL